jgi:hypothetical protein
MPYEEHKGLLDRELSKAAGRSQVDLACPLVREIVNHATHTFVRCSSVPDESRRGGENEDLAIYVLYRHLIAQTDAIEVLLSQCCLDASTPVFRAAFEASLSIDLILIDR